MSNIGFGGVTDFAMTSTATAVRVMGVTGVGSSSETVQGTSLALNFVSAPTGYPVLDPRVTFSRASNATVTGPDGLIAYAPHNLLSYSEQLNDLVWTKNTATVTANAAVAPDGTATADLVTSTGADGYFGRTQSGLTGNQQFTASVYLRADANTSVRLYLLEAVGGSAVHFVDCNVTTVWQRFSVSFTTGAAVTAISTQVGGALSFGTGETVYAWGYQLNVGALQPYYTTTVKNLLGYTQEFDNAAWAKVNSTVTANSAVAPDGTLTADKLQETAVTNFFAVTQNPSGVFSTPYTWSCYAKAGERNFLAVNFSVVVCRATFNLTTGETSVLNGSPVLTATDVGNGWWRCSATFTTPASGTNVLYHIVGTALNSNTTTYEGVAGDGIYIWGAQLSDSASLDPYVYNPIAAPAAAAYYGPRFDYDPVTLAPKGLLIEEQRTNLALYSEQFDDAVWVDSSTTSTTRTANQIAAPDGTLSADLILNTTATNRHTFQQSFTIASSSTVYSASVYAKRYVGPGAAPYFVFYLGNSFQGADRLGLVIDTSTFEVVNTVFVSGLATLSNYSVTPVGNNWYKVSITGSINTVAATTLRLCLGISSTNLNAPLSNSYAGDGLEGVYLWGAQLEAGAFATSYIPTTTAAATRAADAASMIGANFSNWYNAAEGTIYEDFVPRVATSCVAFGIDSGVATTTDSILMQVLSGTTLTARVRSPGTTAAASLDLGSLSANATAKAAFAYQVNNFAGTLNGATVLTDNSGAVVASPTRLFIGANSFANSALNGTISRIAYFPRRLTNAELQGITS